MNTPQGELSPVLQALAENARRNLEKNLAPFVEAQWNLSRFQVALQRLSQIAQAMVTLQAAQLSFVSLFATWAKVNTAIQHSNFVQPLVVPQISSVVVHHPPSQERQLQATIERLKAEIVQLRRQFQGPYPLGLEVDTEPYDWDDHGLPDSPSAS